MACSIVVLAFLAMSVSICQAAYLRIIEAGVPDGPSTPGPVISGFVSLCPKTLFDQFTVECVPEGTGIRSPAWGKFFLNGAFYKREFVGPFVLTGQFLSHPIPWERYPSTAFIECELSNGEEASVTVQFTCSAAAVAVAPVPSPVKATVTPVVTPAPSAGGSLNIDITGTDPNRPPFIEVEI